jgi:S-formylglutathione hydrolase FrmB
MGIVLVVPAGVSRPAAANIWAFAAEHGTASVLWVRGRPKPDVAPGGNAGILAARADGDGRAFPVWVWRPPGPDSSAIPVIYLLHGYPGSALGPFTRRLAAMLDRRLEEGYPPVVVAVPDGNGVHHSDTEWANSYNGSDLVMSRVVEADIPAVEGTRRRPASLRAIAGFSMGGYGAMNIAMQNRGVFGSVVSISGYFVVDDPSDMFGHIRSVMERNDPSAHPWRARGMNVILDEDAHDTLRLVRGQAAWMARLLRRAGVPAILRITPGSHTWTYALSAFQDALTCLDRDWHHAAG